MSSLNRWFRSDPSKFGCSAGPTYEIATSTGTAKMPTRMGRAATNGVAAFRR